MKRTIFPVVLAILIATGCADQKNGSQQVNVEEAQRLIAEKKDLQIVDLRTPAELAATGRIPGAVAINFTGSNFLEEAKKLDRNKPLLVYCAAGSRSAKATQMLEKEGFKEVYDLTSGMEGWLDARQKTVPQ